MLNRMFKFEIHIKTTVLNIKIVIVVKTIKNGRSTFLLYFCGFQSFSPRKPLNRKNCVLFRKL